MFFDDTDAPWHISADTLEYDQTTAQYMATGNVAITKNDKKLTADMIRFNHKTMMAVAEGHVMMIAGEDVLTGNRLEINLKTEMGTLYNGSIFIKENHFYIKGDKIQKTGKDSYAAYKASVSACDGDTPDWEITGKNVKVTLEGYGMVNHAALWAKGIPVLYSPFLIFPVKQKRQSGLLAPRFGYSDENGIEIEQPLYWVISKNSDATFYEHYLEKRGNKLGLEFRYVMNKESKGTLRYDFLHDRKASELPAYDEYPIPGNDRYWLRMKQNQALPFDFSAKLDIDIVSDPHFLDEFKNGYTGFDETETDFYEDFNRGIDDYSDAVRSNTFTLSKMGQNYSLNMGVQWYDHVINRQWSDTDNTLHKLPFVELNFLKQPIFSRSQAPWNIPLYWKLDSTYNYFYRQNGTKGHRIDIYPRIFALTQFKQDFTIEPSIGFRETIWQIDEYDPLFSDKDRSLHRELFDIKIDISSQLFRTYPIKWKTIDRIRHTLKPQITYEYIPEKNQDKYPVFDYSDQIEKMNRLSFSVTNTFISRSLVPKPELGNEEETELGNESFSYQQFCRLKLEQSYDFDDTYNLIFPFPADSDDALRRSSDSRQIIRTKREHSLSPLYGEIELTPGDAVSVQADAGWCPYDKDFEYRNISIHLRDKRGDRVFAGHRYTKDFNESFYTDVFIKLSDKISVYADYERNLHDGKDIRTRAGILYKAQCWTADVSYTDEENNNTYSFMINLNGLGGM